MHICWTASITLANKLMTSGLHFGPFLDYPNVGGAKPCQHVFRSVYLLWASRLLFRNLKGDVREVWWNSLPLKTHLKTKLYSLVFKSVWVLLYYYLCLVHFLWCCKSDSMELTIIFSYFHTRFMSKIYLSCVSCTVWHHKILLLHFKVRFAAICFPPSGDEIESSLLVSVITMK